MTLGDIPEMLPIWVKGLNLRGIGIVKMEVRLKSKVEPLSGHLQTTNKTQTSESRTAPKASRSRVQPSEIQSQRLSSQSHSDEFRNEMHELNLLSSEIIIHSSNHRPFDNMQ